MRQNEIDVITLGCSKNLVDSERLMQQLKLSGFTVRHNPTRVSGKVVVVNTCGFIGDAKEESINMILKMIAAKQRHQIGCIFVMGCLIERYRTELQQELPEVDAFYGKFDWPQLISDLGHVWHDTATQSRLIATPSHYAYLKIAEGCNRKCSYCAIPLITGRYVSRPMNDIVSEAEQLAANGVKELLLIAQDLTYYGRDTHHHSMLAQLLQRLARIDGIVWIRLHYAYPHHFPLDALDVMRNEPKICPYLDMALQHISDHMLTLMRRQITKKETLNLIEKIRAEVPGIHLRTTLLVGHPEETEADFEELQEFVRDMRFERLGAFAYSHEDGTYAYQHYSDNVPQTVKLQRLDTIMSIQEQIANELNAQKVGQILRVMIDRRENNFYVGRTKFDSPDVDGEVLIDRDSCNKLHIGQFYQVLIKKAETFDLFGKIAENQTL